MTAAVSFACGLALVGATFGDVPDETGGLGADDVDAPAETVTDDTSDDAAEIADEMDAPDEEAQPEEEAVEEAEAEEGVEEVAVIPADIAAGTPRTDAAEEPPEEPVVAEPEALPPPIPSDTRFVRGRLAYLRCGSMADADGRCPRDRDLEASTWAVLEAANTCGLGAGSADVRLHFSGGAPELRFRDFGDDPLALGALQACLAPRVAPLRSTLGEAFILSVRFHLR